MKKTLFVIGCWLLVGASSCTGVKSASDVARDACKAAMTADPFVQSLVPAWGATIDVVVNVVCALPNIIDLFATMPTVNATQQAEMSLKRMASAYKSDGR